MTCHADVKNSPENINEEHYFHYSHLHVRQPPPRDDYKKDHVKPGWTISGLDVIGAAAGETWRPKKYLSCVSSGGLESGEP